MVAIRRGEPRDLPRLMEFDRLLGDRVNEIVERRMLVAEVDATVVGYLAWQHGGCIGKDYVNKLVVDDNYRRRGVAQALTQALGTALSGRIYISTGGANTAALSLINGTGWTAAGRIDGLLPLDEPELFFRRDL
ncbi:GNAT family N-acetyltransferase [Sphingomonas sanguinis]|uniref:GNAT family N-acetyltransferase n=1 Tax=Sphingomonas sp. LC-1 TaxID=3110957 RepID=UPI0021BAC31C|nr:GNAT family N-acetyltransferase [Sphingomonas sp. LC-1]MCT8002393.1 GNAT family N-acetyltransferase [Sphingomonas sp. LC-1]